MKKLVLLVVVVAAVWLGVNYVRTGKLSFSPATVSAEEQELRDLEKELQDVEAQISQAGRSAGLAGLDTTADVSGLMERKKKLEERISELRARLDR